MMQADDDNEQDFEAESSIRGFLKDINEHLIHFAIEHSTCDFGRVQLRACWLSKSPHTRGQICIGLSNVLDHVCFP